MNDMFPRSKPSQRSVWLWSGAAVALTALGLTPVVFPAAFATLPDDGSAQAALWRLGVNLTPIAVVAACFAVDTGLRKSQRAVVILLLVLLAFLLGEIHHSQVDDGRYFSTTTNWEWQIALQKSVLALDPSVLPHSYRFLPNATVALIEQGTRDYHSASFGYRILFTFLLLFATYCWSRLYLKHPYALVPLLLYCAIYPISVRAYAGQLTDPMSHLSFVLGFLFLETGPFAYLLLTVLIGILAKESVILVGICFALFRRMERYYWAKTAALLLGSAAVALAVRIIVAGRLEFGKISGVGPNWLAVNMARDDWVPQVFFTVGIFVPFVLLGWKQAPRGLKSLLLLILPGLLASNMLFSWMRETRNLVPAALVMAVITAYYLFPAGREERNLA